RGEDLVPVEKRVGGDGAELIRLDLRDQEVRRAVQVDVSRVEDRSTEAEDGAASRDLEQGRAGRGGDQSHEALERRAQREVADAVAVEIGHGRDGGAVESDEEIGNHVREQEIARVS